MKIIGRLMIYGPSFGILTARTRRIGLLTGVSFFLITLVILGFSQAVFASDGDLDPTFGNAGQKIVQIAPDERDFAKAVAIRPDGKIVVGGELGDFNSDYNRAVLIRLNADGSLDQSFGTNGKVINQGQLHIPALVLQPDGKIVTAGATTLTGLNPDFAVVRYNADGSLDQTFGNGGYAINGIGTAHWILLQPDGRIILIGHLPLFRNGSDFLLARFNPDGSIDQTFGTNGRVQTSFTSGRNSADEALSAGLQTDGKIVVTGFITGISAVLARYNADGSVDSAFGNNGSVLTVNFGATTSRILIQPDGRIVVGGGGFVLGRYESDGRTDQSFGVNGRISGGFGSGNGALYSIARQPDGKLMAAGSVSYTGTGECVFALSRYTSSGILDQSFGNNGFTLTNLTQGTLDQAFAMTLQSDGKAVSAGYAAEPGGSYHDFALTRHISVILTPRQTPFDFDGDGRADISVYRSGTWYLQQGTAGFAARQFGLATDKITPGDFDGDGKTDVAVWRPSEGNWYILNSSNGTFIGAHWGASSDVPLSGDFDGDGRTDLTVFRPAENNWYILRSTAGFISASFGSGGDVPLVMDPDADNTSNIAVFRPGNNTWYVATTLVDPSHNFTATTWGQSGDSLAPADYDGDGKDDVAVFRPSNGTWYILQSLTNSVRATQWGMSGDRLVPADYDGDGKADLGIFRNGYWYILQSQTNTYFIQQFGISTDMPVPAAFLP